MDSKSVAITNNCKAGSSNTKSLESPEYDPHKNRKAKHPTTNLETLIHMLKGCLGTGLLAMPSAFNNSGYIIGLIATVMIGSLATYCLHILIRSQYELCKILKVPVLNYPMTMKAALEHGPKSTRFLASKAAKIVDAFLLLYILGNCCVYVIFVSQNVKDVADYYTPVKIDLKYYMLMFLLPFILINYIKNLKYLTPFSSVANILTFISLGILLYYIFDNIPPISDRKMFGAITKFPLFVGVTLFALESIGVIIALENNMKTPQHFVGKFGVLNQGMFMIITLYAVIGFFGYIKYGETAKDSITLNLPLETKLGQSVKVLFAFSIYVNYALNAYVATDITWSGYLKSVVNSNKIFWEYVCRTIIPLVPFMVGFLIPELELFISLFGTFCLSALGLAFPAIIELCVLWSTGYGYFKINLIKNIIILIFAVLGFVSGTIVSLSGIIKALNHDKNNSTIATDSFL